MFDIKPLVVTLARSLSALLVVVIVLQSLLNIICLCVLTDEVSRRYLNTDDSSGPVFVKSLRRSLKNDDLTLKQIFYTSVSLKTSNFGHSLGQKLTCDSRIAVLRKVQSRILCFPRTNKRLKPRRNSLLTIE